VDVLKERIAKGIAEDMISPFFIHHIFRMFSICSRAFEVSYCFISVIDFLLWFFPPGSDVKPTEPCPPSPSSPRPVPDASDACAFPGPVACSSTEEFRLLEPVISVKRLSSEELAAATGHLSLPRDEPEDVPSDVSEIVESAPSLLGEEAEGEAFRVQ
jgi:hypothetical protein